MNRQIEEGVLAYWDEHPQLSAAEVIAAVVAYMRDVMGMPEVPQEHAASPVMLDGVEDRRKRPWQAGVVILKNGVTVYGCDLAALVKGPPDSLFAPTAYGRSAAVLAALDAAAAGGQGAFVDVFKQDVVASLGTNAMNSACTNAIRARGYQQKTFTKSIDGNEVKVFVYIRKGK